MSNKILLKVFCFFFTNVAPESENKNSNPLPGLSKQIFTKNQKKWEFPIQKLKDREVTEKQTVPATEVTHVKRELSETF